MNRFVQQTVCLVLLLTAFRAFSAGAKLDGVALFKQGRDFQSEGKINEALWSYRQAAKAGNLDGTLAAGSMLFSLGRERSNREQVLQLAEGLGYLFIAATNRQPQACALLSEGMEKGIGFKTNLINAYTWMQIAARGDSAFRGDLDRLVIQLNPDEILQSQILAQDYLSGHWPTNVVRAVDQGDPRLVVQGVSVSDHGTLVILNGNTVAAGESIDVAPAVSLDRKSSEKLSVSCREIGSDYLLVAVEGERNLKLLSLGKP